MNKRLNSIVDLNKYPIHDLESPTIKKLIERCKDDLENIAAQLYLILFCQNH